MNCNYKVSIKDIQSKYTFKIFCSSGDTSTIEQEIGDLANLTTTAKDNLVNAINEVNGNVPSLDGYVKNTDYATDSVGGVMRTSTANGSQLSSGGILQATTRTYTQYNNGENTLFIGKGTLENVIVGKDLTTKSYVDGLVGDINSALDSINGEVI